MAYHGGAFRWRANGYPPGCVGSVFAFPNAHTRANGCVLSEKHQHSQDAGHAFLNIHAHARANGCVFPEQHQHGQIAGYAFLSVHPQPHDRRPDAD